MTSAPSARFLKMNGLGNEIVVLDLRAQTVKLTPEIVRAIAANPRSHFDQMMVLHPARTTGTDAYMTIHNTDGSVSAACGNGTRCVGLYEANRTGKSRQIYETRAGLLKVSVASPNAITVDMGTPRFGWNEIPLAEPFADTTRIELQIGPIDAPILHSPAVVNVGNPHAVFFVKDVESYDLGRFGPLLENHPIFPERANISLAEVRSKTHIKIRTWERGTGLTKACGTAACASAISAMRRGLTDRHVTVSLPGGDLAIEWTPENRILMTGPAELEYEDLLTSLPASATT